MDQISSLVTSCLEMCEYEKRLSLDTIKAYRIDLKQFLQFADEKPIDTNLINQYIKYLNQSFAPGTVKRKLASDTLAAITGSIAEAAYGIPDWIKDKAYSYLDEPLKDVLRRWKKFISRD